MPKFLEVSDKIAARLALGSERTVSVNVLDYISDPDDTATHAAGFQAAIEAAVDGGLTRVVVPGGEWHVGGVTIPTRSPLRIVGAAMTSLPYPQSNPDAPLGDPTILVRTGPDPALTIHGLPGTGEPDLESGFANPLGVPFGDFVRDFHLQNVTIRDENPTASTPLVSMKHAQYCIFDNVTFFTSGSGKSAAPQVDLIGGWDIRFTNSRFFNGGDTGIPQVWIHGSDGEEYLNCQEIMFLNTTNENYFGSAYLIGDDPSFPEGVPTILQFVNSKFESKQLGESGNSNEPHIDVKIGAMIHFKNVYISHKKSSGSITRFQNTAGLYGDLSFHFLGDNTITFSEMVNIAATTYNVNLDVHPDAAVRETDNIVTITGAASTSPTVDVRVHGLSRRINNRVADFRRIEAGVVTQFAAADNSQISYVFSKANRLLWALGNVSNPASDQETFSLKAINPANSGEDLDVALFRAYNFATPGTLNPTTATYRDVAVDGFLNLFSTSLGWVNFQNLVNPPAAPVGGFRLYAANGRLTVDGVPIVTTTDLPLDLDSGEATMSRREVSASPNPWNGQLWLTYFTARRSEVVTSVRTIVNTAAVGTTLARIGLYTVAANGNLTLVASTENDTSLWATPTAAVSKAFSASYSKVRGQRYAVGLLSVGASTAAQLYGSTALLASECGQPPRLCGYVDAQTDLGAIGSTISAASVVDWNQQFYAALIP